MFKKKSAFQQLKAYKTKMDRKAMKMTKNFLKDNVSRRSKMYQALVKWPRRMEIASSVIFLVVICFLFYKKAQDPSSLSDFGSSKL